jgi:hypothetical protein
MIVNSSAGVRRSETRAVREPPPGFETRAASVGVVDMLVAPSGGVIRTGSSGA